MKVTDFNLLKKLMPMTQSEADQEALTAIRQANKILARAGTNWENVFNRLVTVDVEDARDYYEPDPAISRGPSDADKKRRVAYVEDLFERVLETARGDFLDFVNSLKEQWDRTQSLSAMQMQALEKSANRERSRR